MCVPSFLISCEVRLTSTSSTQVLTTGWCLGAVGLPAVHALIWFRMIIPKYWRASQLQNTHYTFCIFLWERGVFWKFWKVPLTFCVNIKRSESMFGGCHQPFCMNLIRLVTRQETAKTLDQQGCSHPKSPKCLNKTQRHVPVIFGKEWSPLP